MALCVLWSTVAIGYPDAPLSRDAAVRGCALPDDDFHLGLLVAGSASEPLLLAAIPLLWSVVGGSAALLLDVPQDLGLPAAAIFGVAGFLMRPANAVAS